MSRDREGHYIIIRGLIAEEDIAILNAYPPNNKFAKFMKQKLIELKGEIDRSTTIVRDFSTPLSTIDRTN